MSHARNEERAAVILGRRASGLLAQDEALGELAAADCVLAIATVIGERLRLRAETVLRALEADSDEVITVMCRAAGFKLNSYSAVLRMRRRRNHGIESEPVHALTFFSALSLASAERLLPRLAAALGPLEN
jgi:hypothetical protein